jgi:hypothetical protein
MCPCSALLLGNEVEGSWTHSLVDGEEPTKTRDVCGRHTECVDRVNAAEAAHVVRHRCKRAVRTLGHLRVDGVSQSVNAVHARAGGYCMRATKSSRVRLDHQRLRRMGKQQATEARANMCERSSRVVKPQCGSRAQRAPPTPARIQSSKAVQHHARARVRVPPHRKLGLPSCPKEPTSCC